jgi:hypothetical protein
VLQYRNQLSRLPIENMGCTMLPTSNYHLPVFSEHDMFRKPMGWLLKFVSADGPGDIKLMARKPSFDVIDNKLFLVVVDVRTSADNIVIVYIFV